MRPQILFDPSPLDRYKHLSMSASNPTAGQDALESLRKQIDALDHQIVDLLNARARIVVDIGKLKQQHNTPIYSPDREKMVVEKVRRLNGGPLTERCPEA